jgi:hypothetical protein
MGMGDGRGMSQEDTKTVASGYAEFGWRAGGEVN